MSPSDLQKIRDAYARGIEHGKKLSKGEIDSWTLQQLFSDGIEVGTARGRDLGREEARRTRKRGAR